jgi:ABC-2 type transport system permease protein
MNKILAVARWEYMEKVKSKIFLIGLLLTPLIMVGMGVLPTLFVSQEDEHSRIIGVIDPSGTIIEQFTQRMQTRYLLKNAQPNYIVLPLAVGTGISVADAVADANRRVAADQIDGYFVYPGGGGDSTVEYRSKTVGDFALPARIEEVLKGVVSEQRVRALGLDPSVLRQIAVKMDVRTVKLSAKGEKENAGFERVFLSAYVFLMMLFLLIVTSGQMLVRSVIEEKSNRIVEVLVSSCSPTQLMAGKVLGLSGLGLTQMAFWALIGVAASLQFGMQLIDPGHALLLVVYFILGYLFYAAIFIAAGSPLNTEQEAQQITSYLVLVLILPIVLALPAMKDPNATWIRVLTYIPFLTPTMMALRIPIQMPKVWEILLTIVIMLISIAGAMVAAGRIFRIGILSTGKSPKLKEIFRWIKNG